MRRWAFGSACAPLLVIVMLFAGIVWAQEPAPYCTYKGVARTEQWFQEQHEAFKFQFVMANGKYIDIGRARAREQIWSLGNGPVQDWKPTADSPVLPEFLITDCCVRILGRFDNPFPGRFKDPWGDQWAIVQKIIDPTTAILEIQRPNQPSFLIHLQGIFESNVVIQGTEIPPEMKLTEGNPFNSFHGWPGLPSTPAFHKLPIPGNWYFARVKVVYVGTYTYEAQEIGDYVEYCNQGLTAEAFRQALDSGMELIRYVKSTNAETGDDTITLTPIP